MPGVSEVRRSKGERVKQLTQRSHRRAAVSGVITLALVAGAFLISAVPGQAAQTRKGGLVVTLSATGCDLTVTATWPRAKRDQYSIDFFLFDRAHPNDNSHQYALPVTPDQTTESHTFTLTSGASTTWFASAVLGSTTSGALAFANSPDGTFDCVFP